MRIFVPFFISLVLLAGLAAADPNPYELNVYTIQNIGSSTQGYGSGFQGSAATGGSAYFSNFSLNLLGQQRPFSLYSGGNVNYNSGAVYNGGIQAGGNIFLNSTSINGNISGGGNLQGGFGTVSGNVSITGTNTSNLSIGGTVQTGQPYTPNLNLPSFTQYFQNASSYWGGLTATGSYQNVFGQLVVSNLSSGRNVVNLTFNDLANAWGIQLNGPSDAFVIFNIADPTPSSTLLKSVTFSLNNGITGSNVLFNITNGTQVFLNGGEYLSILAPNADINFPSGMVTGNLIANNLFGSGAVNQGSFTGFQLDQNNFNVNVPEPTTYMTLAGFLLVAMLAFARKRKAAATKSEG